MSARTLGTAELSDAETRVAEALIRRFAYFMDRFDRTGDDRDLRIATDADARYRRFIRSHRFEAGAA